MKRNALDFSSSEYRPFITYKFEPWAYILKNHRNISYKPNEYICSQYDDEENKIIVVEKGIVRMTFTGADGKEHINFFGARGYVFGWRNLMSGNPYRGSLIAHTDCSVYKVPAREVKKELLTNIAFQEFAFLSEYERGRAYSRKVEMLTLSSAKKKLICIILSLYNKIGYEKNGIKYVPLNITHELLSQIIYSDRVTVSRILSDLKKYKYIGTYKQELIIYDYDKLYDILYSE